MTEVTSARTPPLLSLAALAGAGRHLPERFRLRLELTASAPQLNANQTDFAALAGAFDLQGAAPEQDLWCLEVLRVLPGRRIVARVRLGEREALLKLFLGRDAGRYCAREARGCALLAEAGVPTPELLAAARAPADQAPAEAWGLVFEFLDGAASLDSEDTAGVTAAAAELALLHEAGGRHLDLHLDNFLRTRDGRLVMIDGDGIRPQPGVVGRRRAMGDLAVLCAQRAPLADQELAAIYQAYAERRGWPDGFDPAAHRRLGRATRRARRQRVRRYLRKAARSCSEFLVRSEGHLLARRRLLALRSAWEPALEAFLANPGPAVAGGEVIKAGNSATVVRVRIGEHSRIVKRYNLKSPWQALRRSLRPLPRYRRSWLNGQRLNLLRIPTARPLALLEQRWGPVRGLAYLVMEDCGAADLATTVAAGALSEPVLTDVVQLFQALAAAELCHGDTKASNFLVEPGRVRLIDLDAMTQLGAPGRRREDVARFLANFDAHPETRQRFEQALTEAGLWQPDGFSGPRRRL